MTGPVIGFAGLTHLGLVSAAAAAARGFRTLGYDADRRLIAALEAGEPPLAEPGLGELLAANRERLAFGADGSALSGADVVLVAADVPTDDAGHSDLDPIRDHCGQAIGGLKHDAVLVVLCQVPPGFTRGLDVEPARLYYLVETLVVGQAVERALGPERFILGCADPAAPLPPSLERYLAAFDCPILPMRYESAELAKIAVNLCLAASIGAANTLAELCEKLGADWGEIAPALRLDRRIGPHAYLTPGLGIGGGNLERDLASICALAETSGSDANLARALIADSAYRKDWALRALRRTALSDGGAAVVAILGLAYKADTASTRNAPALALLAALQGHRLRAYDPAVAVADLPLAGVEQMPSALAACEGADALAIMTPWPEFHSLKPAKVARALAGNTVIDPHGVLDTAACRKAGLDHRTLGRPAGTGEGP